MILKESNIPDVTSSNIDKSKKVLAESIINNVYPLFDDVYNTRLEEVKKLKSILEEKKEIINSQKNDLETMMGVYNKSKKVTKLLDRIEKLINAGLVYDGNLKHETIVLLKVINKLDNEKLDHHLKDTLRVISKRFSR